MDSHFNKWCWKNWRAKKKRMKLHHNLTLHTKMNSNWIKDLKLRPETVKLLEENIGRNSLMSVLAMIFFFYLTPKANVIKAKINTKQQKASVQQRELAIIWKGTLDFCQSPRGLPSGWEDPLPVGVRGQVSSFLVKPRVLQGLDSWGMSLSCPPES